jgi:Na+/H+ antiporter NhaC
MILNYNLFEKLYNEKFNLHRINLCRTVNDCAPMFGSIVPWSGGALLAAGAFEINSLAYAPYVWACYIPIILGIIYGFVGNKKMYPTYDKQKEEQIA